MPPDVLSSASPSTQAAASVVARALTRIRLGVAAVAFAAAWIAIPQAQDGQEPTVTFRSSIEAVEIDVYVTDEEGNPVSGLTVDDFELFEAGVQQPITTFTAVDIPIETTETMEREIAAPDVQANNGPEGRLYVFALDEVYEENILRTRQFVRQFLENHFGPRDIGAVVLLGRGLATDGQDFTSNRQLLLESVDKFTGGFQTFSGASSQDGATPPGRFCEEPQPEEPQPEEPQPSGSAGGSQIPLPSRYQGRSMQFESLRSLAELLGRVPGRHKALLLFTECLTLDMLDITDYRGGVMGLGWEDAHAMMTAATRSNLAIYPIDPTGLSPGAVTLDNIGRFRAMAEATGGVALINSNSFTETFERIVRDNSTYYMLGFNSGYDKDDGRYVRLEVKVNRPGLVVRTREGYVAPTRAERRARQRAREREEVPASTASAAIASPLTTDGLPMRVFAAPFKRDKDDALVALALELEASTLGLTFKDGAYTGEVDVSYLATDAKRKIYPERRHTASIRIEANTTEAPPLDGVRVRVLTQLELEKGRYQVRVGSGTLLQSGSVVYDLVVPDFSDGDLTMSGLVLMAPLERHVLTLQAARQGGETTTVKCYSARCGAPLAHAAAAGLRNVREAPESYLNGLLPGPPTALREFASGDEIVLVAEVYDNLRGRRNDPPHAIALTASLRDGDGATIPLATAERPATAERSSSGGHPFAIGLPLRGVAPGPYVLQVEASSTAGEGRSVTREIAIRVR